MPAKDYESTDCLRRWCWCDALFMSPPAWVELSQLTGDPRYTGFAMREFWAATDFLYDPVEKAKAQPPAPLPSIGNKKLPDHQKKRVFAENMRLFDRWVRFKQFVMLKNWKKKAPEGQERGILSLLFFW